MQPANESITPTTMQEMQSSLEKLERREWWRWATALLIMSLLTAGVFALALPEMRRDNFSQADLNRAVYGLIGVVLIFDTFAIYQQMLITRLRRQLSGQIGMLATLEALKPTTVLEQPGRKERRRSSRHPFDQRLKVKIAKSGKDMIFYGRVIDISEYGLGAVLSGALEVNAKVTVEFSSGSGNQVLNLPALVRYGNGFHYGFEFANLSQEDRDQLRKACLTADTIPVMQIQ
ncbi:MAG TPA: PilZ domain-containing protein [Candidatus Angelobacter sp.]|nr:PilZ domain-containing protein [Candidatus Angelobacter sp.]